MNRESRMRIEMISEGEGGWGVCAELFLLGKTAASTSDVKMRIVKNILRRQ